MTEVSMPIIGYMHSPYKEKFGIPRQPNLVQVESCIEMCEPFNDLLAFEGIEEFSHLWLIWQFHDNKNQQNTEFRPQVRPPRLGGNKKTGVFATRSMYRPAPIGLSVVKLKEVRKEGKSVRVYVTGSDLLDGTPVLDIKPYIQYSDAMVDAQSGYAQDEPARKQVWWTEIAEQHKQNFLKDHKVTHELLHELEQVLALDPRPAYQADAERTYGLNFGTVNVRFTVDEQCVFITALED